MKATTTIFIISIVLMLGCSHQHKHHHKHHHKGAMNHSFADAKKWAKVFDDPERDKWQKPTDVVAMMEIKEGMTVADVGAGTGYFLPYLDKKVGAKGKVLAIDVEQSLIDHMTHRIASEKLTRTEAQLTGFNSPGLKEKSVDRILIVDTWHHIGEREKYTQLLKKSLKPGGKIYIVDFEPGRPGPGPKDSHRLRAKVVEGELATSGLKTKTVQENLPYQYIVVGQQ